jgi:uncharacterized protein (TIGR00369 family)
MTSKVTGDEFIALMRSTIPWSRHMDFRVDAVSDGLARVRLVYSGDFVRAGGSVSGPAMMTLADTALYLAVLTRIGMEPLAVTADLNIHFLRKPIGADVIAEARLLKCGKKLAVGQVTLCAEGVVEPVAFATGSYALPSKASR